MRQDQLELETNREKEKRAQARAFTRDGSSPIMASRMAEEGTSRHVVHDDDTYVFQDEYIFEHYHSEIEELTRVVILCWHTNLARGKDFLTFSPGPFIRIKHFPFTNQFNFTQVYILATHKWPLALHFLS